MATERADAALVARRYRLALRGRYAGGAGGRRGRGVGAGMDFHDFRDYALGDDLRHLDWRGLARSDQLRVRVFEPEVAPDGELLLDVSASMASTPAKAAALHDLAAMCTEWVRGEGGRVRWVELGGGELEPGAALLLAGGRAPSAPLAPLRPRGVRVVISDFLAEGDPGAWLRAVAATAGRLVVLQLLDPWELEPTGDGAVQLRDCEDGSQLELELDAAALRAYRERLQRLCDSVRGVVQQCGGAFAVTAAASPDAMCRDRLLPAGILEPRP